MPRVTAFRVPYPQAAGQGRGRVLVRPKRDGVEYQVEPATGADARLANFLPSVYNVFYRPPLFIAHWSNKR
jgi:hypothetical protein